MNAENFPSNNGGDRQAIERVHKSLPYLDVASPLTLIIKTVYSCHIGAFMVAPKEEKVLRELQLVTKQ